MIELWAYGTTMRTAMVYYQYNRNQKSEMILLYFRTPSFLPSCRWVIFKCLLHFLHSFFHSCFTFSLVSFTLPSIRAYSKGVYVPACLPFEFATDPNDCGGSQLFLLNTVRREERRQRRKESEEDIWEEKWREEKRAERRKEGKRRRKVKEKKTEKKQNQKQKRKEGDASSYPLHFP